MKPLIVSLIPVMIFGVSIARADGPDKQSVAEVRAIRESIAAEFAGAETLQAVDREAVLRKYDHLDPKHEVPTDLLETAVSYFDANESKFANRDYLTIVNLKPRSDQYRFFLIDLKTGAVEKYHTTHGSGSDSDRDGVAESFGNVENSGKSSLGFARTAEVYSGSYGRSVRLDGLSSTNSRIRERAIVFHGWDYAFESNKLQGLTLGCIALDWKVKDAVLDKIKNGSLIYSGLSKSSGLSN